MKEYLILIAVGLVGGLLIDYFLHYSVIDKLVDYVKAVYHAIRGK